MLGNLKLNGSKVPAIWHGRGGGGPPDQEELIQWLTKMQVDGFTLYDKLDPLVITPEPTLENINVIGMGTDWNGGGAAEPAPDPLTGIGISFPSSQTFILLEEWHVSFRIKPNGACVSTNLLGNTGTNFARIGCDTASRIRITTDNAGGFSFNSAHVLADVWTKIDVSCDGANNITVTQDDGTPETIAYTAGRTCTFARFGAVASGSSYAGYSGLVDDIIIDGHMHLVGSGGYYDAPIWDVSGHDNHGTQGDGYSYCGKTEGVGSWNMGEGFALTEMETLVSPDDMTGANWGGTATITGPDTVSFPAGNLNVLSWTPAGVEVFKGETYKYEATLSCDIASAEITCRLFRNGTGDVESAQQVVIITPTPQTIEFYHTFQYPQLGGCRWDIRSATSAPTPFVVTVHHCALLHIKRVPALADDAVLNSYSLAILAAYDSPIPSGSIDAGGQSPRIEVMDERQVLLDDYAYTLISEGDLPS